MLSLPYNSLHRKCREETFFFLLCLNCKNVSTTYLPGPARHPLLGVGQHLQHRHHQHPKSRRCGRLLLNEISGETKQNIKGFYLKHPPHCCHVIKCHFVSPQPLNCQILDDSHRAYFPQYSKTYFDICLCHLPSMNDTNENINVLFRNMVKHTYILSGLTAIEAWMLSCILFVFGCLIGMLHQKTFYLFISLSLYLKKTMINGISVSK